LFYDILSMFEQAVLPDTQTPLPLQVEADQAAVFQDVASWRRTRFLWTGLGFAVMLIGLSARFVPELAAFNFFARHPGHARPANAPGSRAAVLAVGREPLASILAKIPSRSQRSSPVMSAGGAILERQRVPPAPPGPPPSGDGGDGPDDFLRVVPGPEAMELLDGWIARTRVYCMSAQFGDEAVAEVHRKSLVNLEALRSSIVNLEANALEANLEALRSLVNLEAKATKEELEAKAILEAEATVAKASLGAKEFFEAKANNVNLEAKATVLHSAELRCCTLQKGMVVYKQPFFVALYPPDKMTVLAIAVVSIHGQYRMQYLPTEAKAHSWGSPKLVVDYLSVSPPELDDDSSTAALNIRQGLRCMANVLGHELVLPDQQDVDPE